MNKQETIIEIQKMLKCKRGYPDMSYLNKLNSQECFWLFMDITMLNNKISKKENS